MSATRYGKLALGALLGTWVVAATACGVDERVSPVDPRPPSAAAGGGEAPEPGPRRREVFLRNPVGVPADNLLVDGDFELSIVSEGETGGQYGWIAFRENGGPSPLLAETGGLCRSGLRCGRLPARRLLFGTGTAAPHGIPHKASIWVKSANWEGRPPEDLERPCAKLVEAYVLHCDSFAIVGTLRPAALPSADGWCELRSELPGSTRALCMYLEVGTEPVLVDAATLLPAPELAKGPLPAPIKPPRATSDRMAMVRELVRARMPLGPKSVPHDPTERARAEKGDGAGPE